uniref:MSP domain-containing protein n=1 Tax=Ascaris lumbricoides TaxID=6252 RepID=A0A0M3IFK0_ASCLU
MALNISPPNGYFRASGGNATFFIISQCDCRLAYKVKCSNNDRYRVTPVYGFVEKNSKSDIKIIRLSGSPKKDKFVIQWAKVPDGETDPQAPFKAGTQVGQVILPVKAE